jgi:hypothetical protein
VAVVAAHGRRGWALPALSLGQLWLVAAGAACFLGALSTVGLASDTYWGIKLGGLILAERPSGLAVVLGFAPVSAEPPNGQWLAHVLLYLLDRAGGGIAIGVAASLLIALSGLLTTFAARELGAGARLAALCGIASFPLLFENLFIRAQTFAYPLCALTVYLLWLGRRRPAALWLLPPVIGLWANLHGSFLLGLLLIGIHLAGATVVGLLHRSERGALSVRRLLVVLIASTAATLANPAGVGLYSYLRSVLSNPLLADVTTEWNPTSLGFLSGSVLLSGIAALIVVLVASRRRIEPVELLIMLAFSYLALGALRSVAWWGFAVLPILARHAAGCEPDWLSMKLAPPAGTPERSRGTTAVAAILLLACLAAVLAIPTLASVLAKQEPFAPAPSRQLVDFLASQPPGGRIFHYQPWSGYLALRLWPAQMPMLDNRIEIHPREVWKEYFAINAGMVEWQALLDQERVRYLVLHPEQQQRVIRVVERSQDWELVYRDETGLVYARRARKRAGAGAIGSRPDGSLEQR